MAIPYCHLFHFSGMHVPCLERSSPVSVHSLAVDRGVVASVPMSSYEEPCVWIEGELETTREIGPPMASGRPSSYLGATPHLTSTHTPWNQLYCLLLLVLLFSYLSFLLFQRLGWEQTKSCVCVKNSNNIIGTGLCGALLKLSK